MQCMTAALLQGAVGEAHSTPCPPLQLQPQQGGRTGNLGSIRVEASMLSSLGCLGHVQWGKHVQLCECLGRLAALDIRSAALNH